MHAPPSRTSSMGDLPMAWGLALAAFVLLTRLPFLGVGYGSDTDTWKFAGAIHEIATTGVYTASRLPGYPLVELSCAPLERLGPIASNVLSAVAAAACAWLVARLFARHAPGAASWDALLAGAAFVFVPAAYIASTSSIDYLWSIAFLLAAWLAAEDGHAGRTALLLGLAVGARLTACLFVVPLGWLLWRHASGGGIARALRFAITAGVIGALWYVPGFMRYGTTLFSYSEPGRGQASALHFVEGMLDPHAGGIALPLVAGQATVLLWGLLGCAAIAIALASLLIAPAPQQERATRLPASLWKAMLLVFVLEGLLYLRLPHDEGYLLPVVPFALLALAAVLPRARFRVLAGALLIAPFVLGVDVTPPKKGLTPATASRFAWHLPVARETVVIEPLRGPLLRDVAKRQRVAQVLDALAAWWPSRPATFRLLAGNLDPMLYVRFPSDPRFAPWEKSYPAATRDGFRAAGIPMFVLPDVVPRLRIEEGQVDTGALRPLAGAEGDLE